MNRPHKPLVLELNARVWLQTLGQRRDKPLTLSQVPDAALDDVAGLGTDYLWLMGVWTRSPRGRELALQYLPQYRAALPDIQAADVIGSPYAVHEWRVAPELGGRMALAGLRRRLRERGIGLILDYVPNHVACDHAWVYQHPDWFIQGGEAELAQRPDDFFAVATPSGRRVIAHGRDPWFPGWNDTAQVNAFNAGYRQAALQLLHDLAGQCDGLRCDMAMLLCNNVFAATWRDRLDEAAMPVTEFWQELIPALREHYPQFLFIAEVYWDMEADLLQLGFDLCYDKGLYDDLLHCDAQGLRARIATPAARGGRLLRFTENHDERRAVAAFGEERCRAAFALAATLPGATLLHGGQVEGRRVKLPVQLSRAPDEPPIPELEAFQRSLLQEIRAAPFRQGVWQLFETLPLPGVAARQERLIAHGWASPKDWRLVAVNLGAEPAAGRVPLHAWPDIAAGNWLLEDLLDGKSYRREGAVMARQGLDILLPPWGVHLFRFRRA